MLFVDKVRPGRPAHRLVANPATAAAAAQRLPSPSASCPAASQYRPKTLEQFQLHADVAANLRKLVSAGWAVTNVARRRCRRLLPQAPAAGLTDPLCTPPPFTGGVWRLPSHAVLWTSRRGQEDAHPGAAAGDLWRGGGEGEERRLAITVRG